MRFSEPSALLLLPLVPGLFFLLLLSGRRWFKEVRNLGTPNMLARFTSRALGGKTPVRGYRIDSLFYALTILFFVLALARPQAGTRLEPVQVRGSDIYVAIDVSKSMRAEDAKPSRFERAKIDTLELIRSLKGDRVGLILFGGDAYVQCPLTTDYEAVLTFVNSLDAGSAVASGTSIAAPLKAAYSFVKPEEDTFAILLLLTDGEDTTGNWGRAARDLARRSIKVFCIGIGTKEGSPIPLFDESGRRTGYQKDPEGNVVISRLDDTLLKEIAEKTQGYYFEAGAAVNEISRFTAAVASMKKRELETKKYTVYEERFQFPLALGTFFLVLSMLRSVRTRGKTP
jgi:Ca-activated chloride channel family protein